MNVLFIEPSGAGGMASYTYAQAAALARLGVQCHVITSQRWTDRETPRGMTVHKIFSGKSTNPLVLLWRCWRLRKEIDLVHWHFTAHPGLAEKLMRVIPLRRKPWVMTVHNVLPHDDNEKSRELYERIYDRMTGLIFHTQYSQSEFHGIFPAIRKKEAVIAHGEMEFLARKPAKPIATDPCQILFFGNIRPYKGLDTLLQAFAVVREKIPQARLRIAGQPLQPFEPYEEIIQLLRIHDRVELRLGYFPEEDIPELMNSAGVVAMPYRHIDQSGVLLLAMGCGRPVVATCVGGIPEVIRHEQTGLLVPPDDVESLSQALIRCLKAPEWAAELGRSARLDVRGRFSWEAIARQTQAFYEDVLSS